MEKEQKKKRFYKKGQIVWAVALKKEVEVKSVSKEKLEITVLEVKDGVTIEHTLPLWSVDVLKYKAKEKLASKIEDSMVFTPFIPKVYFAKVRPDAIIPSKRLEDAGYDIYASIKKIVVDGTDIYEMLIPALTTTMIPTGIGVALPNTHYLNVKHERGSTAKPSMSVLAGVVDSGYRGEIFIAMCPLDKDVLITSEVDKVEFLPNIILYPYSKAIAQGTIDLVPMVDIEEISFEELQKIESERGDTKLGQSGK